MARPPLPLGTPGSIKVTEDKPKVWVARCRFRDHDGVTRHVRAHGASKTAAQAALHESLRTRQRGSAARASELMPASRFGDAATLYLAKVDRKREDSTHALYAYHLSHTILPALGALQLRHDPRSPGYRGNLTPAEIATAALFLAFDATYSTGFELVADGGATQV